MMTTPASAIKDEVRVLIDVQIETFGQPAPLTLSQCIMKERPTSGGRSRMRRRLRCAALCRASLRYGGAKE